MKLQENSPKQTDGSNKHTLSCKWLNKILYGSLICWGIGIILSSFVVLNHIAVVLYMIGLYVGLSVFLIQLGISIVKVVKYWICRYRNKKDDRTEHQDEELLRQNTLKNFKRVGINICIVVCMYLGISLCMYIKYHETMWSGWYRTIVEYNGKMGVINSIGYEVISCKYDNIQRIPHSADYWVTSNHLSGYISGDGKKMSECKYNTLWSFDWDTDCAKVRLNGKYGYINEDGNEIVPCIYNELYDFKNGLSKADLNGKYGYISKKGNVIVPCKYDYIWDFENGYAKVSINGKCGYVNRNGLEIVPCEYDGVRSFSDGMFGVWRNGKYGFVNIDGKEIIPCEYDYIEDFENGIARVSKDGRRYDINKYGVIVN